MGFRHDMTAVATSQEGPLLLTLEEVSRLVSHGHDPAETLGNIVRLIQVRFATNVCSVYLLEQDRGELVLGATVGLEAAGVGLVRMRLDEGLTGLVAETMAPVMVDEATRHPRFKYFPEAGEDPYHSFLGVPLIEAGVVQGVLVVQTVEPRPFSPDEIRMLVTVASQLTPLVGGVRFLGQVAAVREGRGPSPRAPAPVAPPVLDGLPLSGGVGVGRVYISDGFDAGRNTAEAGDVDRAVEQTRLARAMDAARGEITRLSQRISDLVGVDHGAILQAQLMILQDRTIERDLDDVLAEGNTAEAALARVLDKYVEAFRKLTNPMFRERIFDIKDVFRRILWQLLPTPAPAGASGERIVLVGHEASVLDLLSIEPEHLAAVAVEHGGPQSHAAILARSLGVPMVGQVAGLVDRVHAGQMVRVDGTAGRVVLNAAPETLLAHAGANGFSVAPRRTTDGAAAHPTLPRLEANINLLGEVDKAVARGIEGVGLYRTEFLFLARRSLPTEEEQVRLYRKLLAALQGRPASIRTFDLRPDKLAQIVHLGAEGAHSFDWRRVHDSPLLQRLFKDQVRAILRASACGPARLLVPHVTQTETLDLVLDTLAQARHELDREGLEHWPKIPLGIMIEAAAAVPMMGTWAGRVDYFAFGTNDLVASALGIDRDDPAEACRGDALHPGILRLIRDGVVAAHAAGRPVSVCGEMAADPPGAMALAALRVDTLSVAVHHLGAAHRALAVLEPEVLDDLADRLVSLETADQVRAHLRQRA
jgi:phosphotransferase system, enzyme I, PtsP